MINQAVVLAAGESSRFWPFNSTHKSLVKIMGKPIIWYTIESLKKAGVKEIILIQGPKKDVEGDLVNYNLGVDIKYVVQPEPKGMGNAVMLAEKLINGPFFVSHAHKVNAGEYAELLSDKFKETKANLVFLGGKTDKPWLYGMVKLDKDRVLELTEKPEKGKEPSDIMVFGAYFMPQDFFNYYRQVSEHQYAFEDALDLFAKKNDARIVMTSENPSTFKYPWHLFEMRKYLFNKYLKKDIGPKAKIAESAEIIGDVVIEEGATIMEGVKIKGPCYIGRNTIIGNNAFLRNYVDVEENSVVGAYMEVKNSLVMRGATTHSGFIGDSIIGENCKIAAQFCTGNARFDRKAVETVVKGEKVDTGKRHLGAMIGSNTNIGIKSSTMPGVIIGRNVIIGPSTVVMKNIPDNTKYYTKFKEYVSKKK